MKNMHFLTLAAVTMASVTYLGIADASAAVIRPGKPEINIEETKKEVANFKVFEASLLANMKAEDRAAWKDADIQFNLKMIRTIRQFMGDKTGPALQPDPDHWLQLQAVAEKTFYFAGRQVVPALISKMAEAQRLLMEDDVLLKDNPDRLEIIQREHIMQALAIQKAVYAIGPAATPALKAAIEQAKKASIPRYAQILESLAASFDTPAYKQYLAAREEKYKEATEEDDSQKPLFALDSHRVRR